MRPTPINARTYVKGHIEKMLRGNVIKAVNDSPYGFPLVIVPKPDGEFRICVDYREINKVTVVNQGPIPLLTDMISGVRGKPYMASLDLTKAYWQLPMNPEDAEKTTFICEEGTFMFLRVPFGLAGAVAHYQGALRDTIGQIKLSEKQHMANYIDDVFIGAETYEEWQDALYKFLMKIREVNLKIGIKKSSFGGSSVKYLGFRATKDTWYPDPGRVKDLLDRPPPDDLKKLRGFCSAIAFYKRFTPNVGRILEPLYEKLRGLDKKHSKKSRKPISVALDPEVIKAWEDCKKLLQSKIILWHIDPAKEFHIFVDASDTASGSAIMQYLDNDLRPVAFHSKVFNMAERKYGATERELLGVLHALDKYYYIIVGGPTTHIYTDHKPLISSVAAVTPTKPRLARWRTRLTIYNLKWHYIPGREHHLADFLSRPPEEVYRNWKKYIETIPDEEPYDYDPKYPRAYLCKMLERDFNMRTPKDLRPEEIDALIQNYTLVIHDDRLIEDQMSDPECRKIAEYLMEPNFREKEWQEVAREPLAIYARKCLIHKGMILAFSEIGEARLVPVIPACRREAVMNAAHADKMGHLRDPRVRQLLELKCSWPSLKADLTRYLNNCSICTQFLAGRHVKPRPAAFVADKFLEQITMDVFHPGPSKHGFTKALAIIDTWSRFGWVEPIKTESAEDQIKALEASVCKLGVPNTVLTDRAPTYLSETFKAWVTNLGIEVFPGPGYATNHVAVVNRFHRTLREMIAKTASQVEDWVEALPYVMRAYNSTVHPATGFAPVSLVTGAEPHLKLDIEVGARLKPSDLDRKDRLAQWVIARMQAAKIMSQKKEALKREAIKAYEKSVGKNNPKTVEIGDRVMRTCAADKMKGGKQTAIRYFGPYIVSSVEDDGVHCHIVREIDPEGNAERIHLSNLVLAKDRNSIPIFPSEDIIRRENDLRIGPKPILAERPVHNYNTRNNM
jgi:transposase InsO family protein